MRKLIHSVAAVVIGIGASLALTAPATAITGGTEDLGNMYSNVGMVVFYQPDGRFRCSGTLDRTPGRCYRRTLHVPGHRTGRRHVRSPHLSHRGGSRGRHSSAADDSGPDDAISDVGFTAADITAPDYGGEQNWFLGTAGDPPAIQRFHRSQELERHRHHHPRHGTRASDDTAASGELPQPVRPAAAQQHFDSSPSATEPRYGKPRAVLRVPTPMREPIVRRYTTEIGQKLTTQILQTNGNENDPRAGGGTCFGDSGGPAIHGGYIVGDTSYGFTNNCRYIGGYQRVDIPVVRNWLLDCLADLDCPTKE